MISRVARLKFRSLSTNISKSSTCLNSSSRAEIQNNNAAQKYGMAIGPLENYDLKNQTILCEDGSRKVEWLKDRQISPVFYDGILTTYDAIRHGRNLGSKKMIGNRIMKNDELVWNWVSYDEGIQISDLISQSLRKIGAPVGDQYQIGIFSKNRPEWIFTDMACHNFSNVSVPIYETISKTDVEYIINLAELSIIFVDSSQRTETLLEKKSAGKIDILKHIIQYDSVDNELLKKAEKTGVKLWSYDDFVKMGEKCAKENPQPHVVPKPETVATISFTSGTTGRPKGVILTHLNLCSVMVWSKYSEWFGPGKDTYLSYLPMAHIFERVCIVLALAHGSKIGIFRGDPQLLIDDVQSLKPTTLSAVPRVVDKIHKAVMRQVRDRPLAKLALKFALNYKIQHFKMTGKPTRNTLVDKYILSKIQNILGPNLRQIVIGASKADTSTLWFVRGAFGVHVFEGYGQTETSGPTCVQMPGDTNVGIVGPPLPCCRIRIDNHTDLDVGGELQVKGFNVTSGYFKDEKATRDAFTPDGFLKTGDIARLTSDGAVEVVDRIRNVFKLSQGKFVAPEQIESVYMASDFVQQIYVHGDMTKPWLIAVVVPDPQTLSAFAYEKYKIEGKSFEELCNDERLTEAVTRHLIALTKSHNMPRYEGIYGVHLTPTIFSAENNLTTPTLKNKRANLAKHFKKQLDAIYEKLEAAEK